MFLFLFSVFLQVLWNLLCLLDLLFSGRWEIRNWEFSQPVDLSAISADIISLILFEETTSQMPSCNAHEIDGFSLWACRSLACDDFELILWRVWMYFYFVCIFHILSILGAFWFWWMFDELRGEAVHSVLARTILFLYPSLSWIGWHGNSSSHYTPSFHLVPGF